MRDFFVEAYCDFESTLGSRHRGFVASRLNSLELFQPTAHVPAEFKRGMRLLFLPVMLDLKQQFPFCLKSPSKYFSIKL